MKSTSLLFGLIFSAICHLSASESVSRPNIILILADDLGYETLGANGGTSYKTPTLDKLATTGVRFSQCYVQPLCTPTRVQLMTGQYNVRNYYKFGVIDSKSVTFAHLLQKLGYSTCVAGKWQLGQEVELPKKLGFDEYYLWQHTRRPPRYANPGLEINGVPKDFTHGEYGPDLINEYALNFISRNKDRPFFLYYPMMLTHAPYQPTPDSKEWDPKAYGEKVNVKPKHFADMVVYMDKLIGEVVAKLEMLYLRERTLLLFVGDNGTGRGMRSMMGDKVVMGGKSLTIDTGMHVPLIASWPGNISSGIVCTNLVDSTDFLPTLVDVAGSRIPANILCDGRSFLPLLRGKTGMHRQWIYSWYSPRQSADFTVREFAFNHHFKLYRSGEFFDLLKDAEEKLPLKVDSLEGDAQASAKLFLQVLDRYKDARPQNLDQEFKNEIKVLEAPKKKTTK